MPTYNLINGPAAAAPRQKYIRDLVLAKLMCRHQGRSQDFTLGATEAERRRRENRGAETDGDWEGGVPLPNQLGGLGSVVRSPSGVRGGAPAANAFLAYLR